VSSGLSALSDAELGRLLSEDCPYGDLTTQSIGIAAQEFARG
jgi:nicotinate-nucleotide pyrophosphorylase